MRHEAEGSGAPAFVVRHEAERSGAEAEGSGAPAFVVRHEAERSGAEAEGSGAPAFVVRHEAERSGAEAEGSGAPAFVVRHEAERSGAEAEGSGAPAFVVRPEAERSGAEAEGSGAPAFVVRPEAERSGAEAEGSGAPAFVVRPEAERSGAEAEGSGAPAFVVRHEAERSGAEAEGSGAPAFVVRPEAERGRVGILHLGPVARECDPALADHIPADFLGLTPQGWMRRWDGSGRVFPGPWEEAEALLPRANAVVLSEEDIGGDEALAARWAAQTRILAVTRGARGCSVYADGRVWHLPAFPAREVDPTGAGDVFAAVFFARLWQGDDPIQAARRANCIAAISVTRPGLSGTPTPAEVARCLR